MAKKNPIPDPFSPVAQVLPAVVARVDPTDRLPAEVCGDLYSLRHALMDGHPVQVGEMTVVGYDDRGLETVFVIEGSLPAPASALVGEMRILRKA